MNSAATRPDFGATSAAGAMLRQVREPFFAGVILVGLGTSAAAVAPPLEAISRLQRSLDQTSAGASLRASISVGSAIGELRRRSGLTWDQLARVFNVSRRALHFWASGKAMTPSNEEHLQRLLAVIRQMDTGAPNSNRRLLLQASANGSLPLDLLAAGSYEQALAILALGGGERHGAVSEHAGTTRAGRSPRPPEELVGALQDRVHPSSGRLRATKAVSRGRRT